MTWPLTWLVQLWYIKIWPLTWLVQLWHITIWPLTWLVQPSQNPLACLYKPRVCGNKAELLRRNPSPLIVSSWPRGWVGRQQAHLSSGPLGFAEGSSTASLFLRSAARRKPMKGALLRGFPRWATGMQFSWDSQRNCVEDTSRYPLKGQGNLGRYPFPLTGRELLLRY